DPCYPGDEAIGFDGAKDFPRFGIDLMDLLFPIYTYPKRSFGPCQPRFTAVAGRRNRRQNAAGVRIDFLNATIGDLEKVLAVKGLPGRCGPISCASCLPTHRVDDAQLVYGGDPDLPTVVRHPIHSSNAWGGAVFTEDLCFGSFHAFHADLREFPAVVL